ncbi:transposase [Streptomyces sp. NPDC101490]|uniref:transposase n=1 Tax=Streptomyces sp. NPDC101490 TaxID=3366143 RepID=UPI003801232C
MDDFAIHRGQTYATVLTRIEDHGVVDVLPAREGGPLAAWLIRHPGMEIICRDRAGACAEGARHGAPDALQVADRFHLWQGLGRAVETCVAAHRDCLRNPSPSVLLPSGTRQQDNSEPVGRLAERKKAAHALVHELLAEGHSRRAIARHLGRGLNTVLRYANAARWQETFRENRPRPSRLAPYKPCLERRFTEGCTSVTRLHGELLAEHAPVTYGMVRAHIATLRVTPEAPPRPPTVRQMTGWLTRHPTTLTEQDRAGLKGVLARCPELDTPPDTYAPPCTLSVRPGPGPPNGEGVARPVVHRATGTVFRPFDGRNQQKYTSPLGIRRRPSRCTDMIFASYVTFHIALR